MTRFEELCDLITRNKNKGKKSTTDDSEQDNQSQEIEVAGSESTKKPIISFGDDNDLDLIEQLHYKERHRPLFGENAERWDD